MDISKAQAAQNPVYRRRLLVHRLGIALSSIALAYFF